MRSNKVSFFKKLSLFKTYRKVLSRVEGELSNELGSRVDNSYRIYNVINIPSEDFGGMNMRKSDIDRISESYIKSYLKDLSNFLDKYNLKELYGLYEVKKVSKYSYLVVVGFNINGSNFRSNVYYNYRKVIISLIILSAIFGILFLIL